MNAKTLRQASVIYLLLPNLIFFYSWTKLSIAVAGIILLIYLASDDCHDPAFQTGPGLGSKDLMLIAFTGWALTILSGTAGYCYQTFDYWSHNTKFNELFRQPWPLRIPANGPVISYYYGYYVVPALFFKLLGHLNETVIVIWTTVGLAIGIAWVYLALNKKIWFVFAAMCTGDFPHFLKNILGSLSIRLYTFSDFGMEHWSAFENLFWVPNQVIPSLIIAGMLAYILQKNLNIYLIVFPVTLIFWWSIFPAFTTSLFVGLLILKEWLTNSSHYKSKIIAKKLILPAIMLIPILIYLLSHQSKPVSGMIWAFRNDYFNLISEYSVNILLNVIVFITIYYSLIKMGFKISTSLPFLAILLLTLIFPFFRLGKVNDFLFRGMIPLLLFMGIYLYQPLTIYNWNKTFEILRKSFWGWILIFILMGSIFLASRRVWRAFNENRFVSNQKGIPFARIPYDAYPNVYEVLKHKWSQQEADQYLGKAGSLYERYIAP